MSLASTFAAVGVSASQVVPAGDTVTYALTGTFVAGVLLEYSENGGGAWFLYADHRGTVGSNGHVSPNRRHYRFRCTLYTSGTVTYSLTTTATAKAGTVDTLAEQALGAGIKLLSRWWAALGTAAGAAVASLGGTIAEGLQLMVIEETVSLVGAGAKYKALTTAIPAGCVIVSVNANIESLVVAGGTSVKVGLGKHGGTCNTYGASADLVKNHKLGAIADWAVLSADEQIDVCACATVATGLGDTNFSAGSVRVRIVYLQLLNLADAA